MTATSRLVGTYATTAQESFDTAHPIYRHLADVSALREEHPTLADGAQLHRIASGEPGIYAFSRISDEATSNTSSRRTTRRKPRPSALTPSVLS